MYYIETIYKRIDHFNCGGNTSTSTLTHNFVVNYCAHNHCNYIKTCFKAQKSVFLYS